MNRMKHAAACLGMLLILTGPGLSSLNAVPDDPDPLEAFQKKVIGVVDKVKPGFVFIGGGSGVFVSADGYFVTNHHVAELLPKKIRITLGNGKHMTARRLCTDPVGDLALYRAEGITDAPFLPLGDSDALSVGQYVIAMGNPFNLSTLDRSTKTVSPTMTLGIISALHRQYNAYADAVQTDAPINPGNSGGPLIDMNGVLIGINGRIATRFASRVNSGVGYAIPSNQVARFLPLMKKGGDNGYIYHGRIDGLRLSNRYLDGQGIMVAKVQEGSTAEKSGFKSKDLIVQINDYTIYNRARFLGVLGTYPAGETLKVGVVRDGKPQTLSVLLDRIPLPGDEGLRYTGLVLDEIDGELLISDVKPDSPAERAGIMPGDQLLSADGKKMRTPEQFWKYLKGAAAGSKLRLVVERLGKELVFEIEPAEKPKEE